MKIYQHNRIAIDNCLSILKNENKVCVVHPTGTGKAVIIAQLLNVFSKEKCIVVGPTTLIAKEIAKHSHHDFIFYTFKSLELLSEEEVAGIQFDYLFVDEFHRMGAKGWYKIIAKLESNNPFAKYIGLSATPIRYLDNQRDMSREFFNNNVASYISLIQAIRANILPMPRYVSAIYSVDNEYRNLVKKIIGTNNNKIYTEKIHSAIVDWEKASGLLSVFTKHLLAHDKKFIVFCSKMADIKPARSKLTSIFESIKGEVKCYTITSSNGYATNNRLLNEFSEEEGPCLCFTVDMFNEAIHMDGVRGIDGVILLRFTASPNVFYQQIGRCLSVNQTRQPIIFDLVNNFSSLMHSKFKRELEHEFDLHKDEQSQIPIELRLGRAKSNKDLIAVSFFDETREIRELFFSFSNEFGGWEAKYQLLVEIIGRGQPISKKDAPSAYNFVHYNKQLFKNGALDKDKVLKLQRLGIDLNIKTEEDKWLLIKEGAEWRHPTAPFYNWMRKQRKKYLMGKLTDEHVVILKSVGVSLEDQPSKCFDEYLMEYKLYRSNNNYETPMNDDLKRWVRNQRMFYNRGDISLENKQKLDDIEFMEYNDKDRIWELSFRKYSNGEIDRSIRGWIRNQKSAFHNGLIKPWRKEKLSLIGFDFEPTKIVSWSETFNLIKDHAEWRNVKALRKWVIEQGRRFREGRLSEDKVALLKSVGITVSNTPYQPLSNTKNFKRNSRATGLNSPAAINDSDKHPYFKGK